MANGNKRGKGCGPVIACGAAGVSLNHEPGEPTSVDNLIAAIKRLAKGERKQSSVNSSTSLADHPVKATR